jgi:hypothetical protein
MTSLQAMPKTCSSRIPQGPFEGRDAVRAAWIKYFETKFTHPSGKEFSPHPPVTSDFVQVADDMAYSRGRFWHGEAGMGPEGYLEGGYYLAVWQRVGDRWMIVSFVATVTRTKPAMTAAP